MKSQKEINELIIDKLHSNNIVNNPDISIEEYFRYIEIFGKEIILNDYK